jgi:hypothetical protein
VAHSPITYIFFSNGQLCLSYSVYGFFESRNRHYEIKNIGFDLKNGKIEIKGQGDAELSTTSIDDVARFVAYALTELPEEKLENAKFSIEGDRSVGDFDAHACISV